ncbi:MAG: preprotein translocase subunit YajC [Gammaproteobacteria bacterium]|nr:preprotein translocase subunit YajC [Gammaproteobacteria bacterium]
MNVFDFLIAPVFANSPAPQAAGGGMTQIILFGAILAVFYFLLIRPQSKRAKEHRNMVSALVQGNEIITTGGMAGKIVKVSDDFITLKISENVDILLQKQAVGVLLPNGTLQATSSSSEKNGGKKKASS